MDLRRAIWRVTQLSLVIAAFGAIAAAAANGTAIQHGQPAGIVPPFRPVSVPKTPASAPSNPNDCSDPLHDSPVCITDAQIQTELTTFLAAHSITPSENKEFFVFLPRGVQTCLDTDPNDGC